MKYDLKQNFIKLRDIIVMVYEHLGDPYYQGSAATIAYFLFLSILPIVILASQALGLFSLSIDTILKWAEINVSGDGFQLLQSLLKHRSTGTNNLILAVIALFAASRANIYLVRLANYTFYDGAIVGKGYVRDRVRSMVTVIIALGTFTLSLVILVYAPLYLETVFKKSEIVYAIGEVWLAMRWIVVLGLYYLVISLVFYFLPSWRLNYVDIIPGSLFTAVGLIIVSIGFNAYVSLSMDYDLLYGSFANAVAIIIWFWAIGWVMVIGIIFNRVWWAVRSKNKLPIPEDVVNKRNPTGIF
ncbi:MAG: YihY/virulence factor BrkB family protein [Firmicutes bacterium]|nr:YihY/virulence factor BrkB family protein [Bacillota bacterium]